MPSRAHLRRTLTLAITVAAAAAFALEALPSSTAGAAPRGAPDQDPTATVAPTQVATTAPVTATSAPTITVSHTEPPSATSTSTPTPTASPTPGRRLAYLPVLVRFDPPIPYKPVLRPIANPEEDGVYTVEWGQAELALRYELQEDEDPDFESPVMVYAGPDFRSGWSSGGRPYGTYHYRVRGVNDTAAGAWSDVQSTRVRPPKTFDAVADADVSDQFTSVNTGLDIGMWVGFHQKGCLEINDSVGTVRSLVRFDLGAVPPGTPFARAVLRLTAIAGCWSSSIEGQWRDVTAYRLTTGFDEQAVAWKSRPKDGEAVGTGRVHAADDLIGPVDIDVTGVVRRWVDGAAPNHGLLLRAPETKSRDAFMVTVFGTREWKEPKERPVLVIEYGDGD